MLNAVRNVRRADVFDLLAAGCLNHMLHDVVALALRRAAQRLPRTALLVGDPRPFDRAGCGADLRHWACRRGPDGGSVCFVERRRAVFSPDADARSAAPKLNVPCDFAVTARQAVQMRWAGAGHVLVKSNGSLDVNRRRRVFQRNHYGSFPDLNLDALRADLLRRA